MRARALLPGALLLLGACREPPAPPAPPAPAPARQPQPATSWPSPAPLPERSLLAGNWVVASIGGAAPPPDADIIHVAVDGSTIRARSQCVPFPWRYRLAEGRLALTPINPGLVCARGLSAWEKAFQEAMNAATGVAVADGRMVISGAAGAVVLRRP